MAAAAAELLRGDDDVASSAYAERLVRLLALTPLIAGNRPSRIQRRMVSGFRPVRRAASRTVRLTGAVPRSTLASATLPYSGAMSSSVGKYVRYRAASRVSSR